MFRLSKCLYPIVVCTIKTLKRLEIKKNHIDQAKIKHTFFRQFLADCYVHRHIAHMVAYSVF